MIIFKAGNKTYAIISVSSASGKTEKILFLTASKTKDIEEWEETLKKLDNPKVFHNPPQWTKKEEEKFWNDWVPVWEPNEITPGETRFKLFVNVYDRKSFLYRVFDLDGEYHISPGRYYVSYQPLTAQDEIYWLEGTWKNCTEKRAKISDLVSEKDIEEAIKEHLKAREEHLKAIEEKEREKREEGLSCYIEDIALEELC